MVPNRFALVLPLSLFALAACGSAPDSSGSQESTTTSAHTERYCPGAHAASDAVVGCPAPASVRPGYACATDATCPSPNGLFGECRCVGAADHGKWACDRATPPDGYDPYPDCPDDGVAGGGACYLEGSRCMPLAASACFTKDVPLCTCEGHTWKC